MASIFLNLLFLFFIIFFNWRDYLYLFLMKFLLIILHDLWVRCLMLVDLSSKKRLKLIGQALYSFIFIFEQWYLLFVTMGFATNTIF